MVYMLNILLNRRNSERKTRAKYLPKKYRSDKKKVNSEQLPEVKTKKNKTKEYRKRK